jgi:hypothetical protein
VGGARWTRTAENAIIPVIHLGPGLALDTGVRAVLCLAALALPGCLYLDVINVAPVARIERLDSGPLYIGNEPARLTARMSDDEDGDALVYDWQARACAGCVAFASDTGREFDVPIYSHATVRVRLVVFDRHGAQGEATIELPVTNRDPTLQVQVSPIPGPDGTHTVTRPIDFAASGADPDGDSIDYRFVLYPPPGSDPNRVTFSELTPTNYRLEPDVPGRWEVEVTAEDRHGGAATVRETVMVAPDAPPCIAATSPACSPEGRVVMLRAAGPRRFAVDSVVDDLDAHPGSGIHFRWLVSLPGSGPLVEVAGRDLPDLVLDPADLDPGDVLAVRVEVADRVERALPCAGDQAACSIRGDSCLQRLTWTVEVC